MRSHERTVRLFPLFTALSMTPFMVPVMVLFWMENGLGTFEVYLLQALFAGAVVLLEVPTGMLASLGGRLFFTLTGPVIGLVGEFLPLTRAILVQGVALVVLCGTMGVTYLRIPEKYFRVKASVG